MGLFIASLPFVVFIAVTWFAAGYIVVRHVFHLTDGITVWTLMLPCGLMLYLLCVNALSYIIFVPISVWIVNIGIWLMVAFVRRRPVEPLVWDISRTKRIGLGISAFILFLFMYWLNAREVWVDSNGHASWVEMMASGQFPPRFQCRPDELFGYHYGGDLLAASAVDTARLTPWDGDDIVAVSLFMSVVSLAFLIAWRRTKSVIAGLLSIFMVITVGHITWLLMPLGSPGMGYIAFGSARTSVVPLTVETYLESLWTVIAMPPRSIPPTFFHLHRSVSWAFAPAIILLFLALLETPIRHRGRKTLALAYVLGSVTLVQSGSLVLLGVGFGLFTILSYLPSWQSARLDVNPWAVIGIGVLIAVMQGGVLTDTVRDTLAGNSDGASVITVLGFRLPSCTGSPDLSCTLLTLGNMGLIPFILPVFAAITLQKRTDAAQMILVMGAFASIFLPYVIIYGPVRWDFFRLIVFANWVLAVFMAPWLYTYFIERPHLRALIALLIGASCYIGVWNVWMVITGEGLHDTISLDFSPLLPKVDQDMMRASWLMPLDALVFDPIPCGHNYESRPAIIFGRYTISSLNRRDWEQQPAWYADLVHLPRAEDMASHGYSYVYIDPAWYNALDETGKGALQHGHYEVINITREADDFRILLRVCQIGEVCEPRPEDFPPYPPLEPS